MKRLAIETATRHCQLALDVDGRVLTRRGEGPRMHAEVLLPWIDEVLGEADIGYGDLNALVVDRGPGGFTSLRIGLGVAQGIAIAHDLPVHSVSSLAALAVAGAPDGWHGQVLAALDARMGEIYAGRFDIAPDRAPEPLGAERLLAPERLTVPDGGPFIAVGDAFDVHAASLKPVAERAEQVIADAWPTAEALLELAHYVQAVPAHRVEPTYLRDNVTS